MTDASVRESKINAFRGQLDRERLAAARNLRQFAEQLGKDVRTLDGCDSAFEWAARVDVFERILDAMKRHENFALICARALEFQTRVRKRSTSETANTWDGYEREAWNLVARWILDHDLVERPLDGELRP